MRLLVAVPTFDGYISTETYQSLWAQRKRDIDLEFVKGYTVDRARNEIAAKAMGYDRVLMLDSDIVLPPDALAHMTSPEADIVLGAYPRKRTRSGKSELFRLGKGFGDDANIPMREVKATCGRIPVEGGGLGCALIKSVVFARMGYPFFKFIDDGPGHRLSEDFYFCKKARDAGFEIQADCRVQCGHVATQVAYC